MIKIKPQNPKGVRDFLPEENRKREYIISVIQKHYERYGFEAIYTPSFERLETLQGKYGDEGDKLLFKILNSGEYLTEKAIENIQSNQLTYGEITKEISSKGLRYDLTVPLARFVSQHQNDISFPFKRYHIAPVWRADRPGKGRYQEFYQCDADIVGTKSLVADVELLNLIADIFQELNLKVEIKLNNRKIYNGICSIVGILDKSTQISTFLDKEDKIGEEKVKEELNQIMNEEQTTNLLKWLSIKSLDNLIETYNKANTSSQELEDGIREMQTIFQYVDKETIGFDLKLLRGLDYYTGTVLEMVSKEMQFGSIGGGGRYDNLTEIFGLKDISGIGISFGLDRIYDVMTELNRFPETLTRTKMLILNLTENATSHYFSLLADIRKAGIAVDLYPTIVKMDKQLSYADKARYTHAILLGDDELAKHQVQVKNLKERKQESIDIKMILSVL